MNEPKPIASLTGSLLARKGAARPAMRPQVQRLPVDQFEEGPHLEDLGWDDMGASDEAPQRHAEILPLTPVPASVEEIEESRAEDRAAAAQLAEFARRMSGAEAREVLRQQEMIAEKLVALPVPVSPQPSAKPASTPARQGKAKAKPLRVTRGSAANREEGRRAAFTLRLDHERHIKLRLATTIRGRSAQQLVTVALDRLLEDMPELELLAAQLQTRGNDCAN